MKKCFSKLQKTDNASAVTMENASEFLYCLQSGLLLALRERGTLGVTQHRYAAEKLKNQQGIQHRKRDHS